MSVTRTGDARCGGSAPGRLSAWAQHVTAAASGAAAPHVL